jgi:tetratricopeptide (TPR) repeat protein
MGRIERVATAATVQGFMDQASLTPLQAHELLAEKGRGWWRAWDVQALQQTCAAVPDEALAEWPDVARWRALLAVMTERPDAMSCLELAYEGHVAQGEAVAAQFDAHLALVVCSIDFGTLRSVSSWLHRAGALAAPMALPDSETKLWLCAGIVARAIHGGEAGPGADAAAAWLSAQLQPMAASLSPDERLIAAELLLNLHMFKSDYERFDVLASAVEEPARFLGASPVTRARWLHTLGYVHYQIGNIERAESCWARGQQLAAEAGLVHIRSIIALALLRLLIDRGRLAEAEALETQIQPHWGPGREFQLLLLKQLSARLHLARDRPVRALATLQEARALARQTGLSESHFAGCDLDLAQLLIANGRAAESERWLEQLAKAHIDRDAEVFRCLFELLSALHLQSTDVAASRALLAAGLQRAQRVRYAMFFRLLPHSAAAVCALSLRWNIEPTFAAETVRARDLPAPDDADERWPWALYLRLQGRSSLRLRGEPLMEGRKGKVPRKPLELLRALACEPQMSLSTGSAADTLWPDSAGDDASKNLEMTVQRLRRMLGDDGHGLVHVSEGRISLDRSRVSSDIAIRRSIVKRLEVLSLGSPTPSECTELVQRFVALSDGPLLPGEPESAWLESERQRCRRDIERARRAAIASMTRAQAGAEEIGHVESALAAITGH